MVSFCAVVCGLSFTFFVAPYLEEGDRCLIAKIDCSISLPTPGRRQACPSRGKSEAVDFLRRGLRSSFHPPSGGSEPAQRIVGGWLADSSIPRRNALF